MNAVTALTPLSDLSDAELVRRIGYAANNGESDRLVVLNAEKARRDEDVNPALKIARLEREARALDDSAERLAAQGAEFAGKAARRRIQGEHDLAAGYQSTADAAEALAAQRADEAADKRAEASSIRERLARIALLALLANITNGAA